MDSNHRPRAYQARALTTWAMSPCKFFGVSRLSLTLFGGFITVFSLLSAYSPACEDFHFKLPSTVFACPGFRTGGDDGNRTHDPLLAGQVLSQLSYTPIFSLGLLSFLSVTQNWTTIRSVQESGVSLLSRRLFSYLPTYEYDLTISPRSEIMFSIERRWSSRTFRYGYLVTT